MWLLTTAAFGWQLATGDPDAFAFFWFEAATLGMVAWAFGKLKRETNV